MLFLHTKKTRLSKKNENDQTSYLIIIFPFLRKNKKLKNAAGYKYLIQLPQSSTRSDYVRPLKLAVAKLTKTLLTLINLVKYTFNILISLKITVIP